MGSTVSIEGMETKEAEGCPLEATTWIKDRLVRKGPRPMSKKKKSKKAKPGNNQAGKGKNRRTLVIIAVSAIVIVAAVVVVMQLSKKASYPVSGVDDQSLRKGETRETLSPSMFAYPLVARRYQAARDIPHVFDSLKCYCNCERPPFYHVSLLSCFVDRHAET